MSELAALRQLTLTRARIMIREPEVVFWVFAFPVLLAIGLGIAFSDPMPDPGTPGVADAANGVTGRYIDWLIPGIIGFNLMSTGLWSVGFYITQSRQNLQLKRLVATPMRRSHFLLAQILARFAFLVVEIPLVVLAAWLIFDVRLVGSVAALSVVVLVGAACFCGFGLLASSRTRTTEGVSGIINVIVMPMVVLSGVFFSSDRFPDAIQPLIGILPLTVLNDALRAIYNEGLPLSATAGELALLAGWTVVTFYLALRLFRWQ
jgi:ABC-2 type transport system permease protein